MLKKRMLLLLVVSHIAVGVAGFAAGIYVLPILVAPPAPSEAEVRAAASQARYTARFRRDLEGSDAFHWGEGVVTVGQDSVTLMGTLAPGPDYKLYFSPEFVETEAEFNRLKPDMARIGDVKTFENFVVAVPPGVDPSSYSSVIVWCESFGEFITSARYR